MDKTEGPSRVEDNFVLSTIIPIVIIVVLLIIAMLIACILYRRNRKGSFVKHVIVQKRRAPSAKCLVQHCGALRGKLVERTRFARLATLRYAHIATVCSLRCEASIQRQ